MKKLKIRIMVVLAFLMATLPLPIASVAWVGCSGCAALAPGADAIVVRAEQTAAASFEIMDAFVAMEENNREELRKVTPEIEKAANRVRVEGRTALEGLRSATKAYKEHRTPEKKANIETYLALVQELQNISKKFIVSKK